MVARVVAVIRASDREACQRKADEWVRLAIAAEQECDRHPPRTRGHAASLSRARALQQCAAELRELMGPVRRG